MNDTSGAAPTPWNAMGLLLGAHLALLIGGSVVIAAGGWEADDLPIGGAFLASVPFWVAGAVGAWWLADRHGDPRDVLRLRVSPIDVPVGLAIGAAVQLVVLPIVYWPVLQVADRDVDDLEESARRVIDSADGPWATVLLVAMTCVLAPVLEELLYRGVLQRSLAPWGPVRAVGGAALVFAAFHFQALQFLGLVVIGATAGWAMVRTGRLGTAIMIHAGFNAATVVMLS